MIQHDPHVLEERATRFYYTLKKSLRTEVSGNDAKLTRLALFLADAIHSSDLSYAQDSAILDLKQNPYLAFLTNTNAAFLSEDTYCCNVFTAISVGISDPTDPGDWVYSTDPKHFMEKLEEKLPEYKETNRTVFLVDFFLPFFLPNQFDLKDEKMELLCQIYWLFNVDLPVFLFNFDEATENEAEEKLNTCVEWLDSTLTNFKEGESDHE